MQKPLLSLRSAGAAAVVVAGLALAIVQMKPPPDSGFAFGWFLDVDPQRFTIPLRALIGSYSLCLCRAFTMGLPVGVDSPLADLAGVALAGFMILILGVFAAVLRNRPSALLVYGLATFACLLFYYVKYPGSIRHHGFLFIALIVSMWISPSCTVWSNRLSVKRAGAAAHSFQASGLRSDGSGRGRCVRCRHGLPLYVFPCPGCGPDHRWLSARMICSSVPSTIPLLP